MNIDYITSYDLFRNGNFIKSFDDMKSLEEFIRGKSKLFDPSTMTYHSIEHDRLHVIESKRVVIS